MTPLIDAVRAFLIMATHGRELPLDATEFEAGDPMRAYLEALNDLHAAVEAAVCTECAALKRRVASLEARLELSRNDCAEARGVAKQLWRDGAHETTTLLPGDHPWMLEGTS